MMYPEEFPDTGHPRVCTTLVKGRAEFLRVQTHTTELIDVERVVKTTDTLLLKDHRAPILPFYGDITK